MMKNVIQITSDRSEGLKKKKLRQKSSIPRYIGCLTNAYTPESMSLVLLSVSSKTALCDFETRYKLKVKNKIVRSMSMGKEINPMNTVEYLKI
jgi:hypothetical protein